MIVLHNGPLTREQQLRADALHVGPKGCLAETTALEMHGFRGLGTPDPDVVHVLHPRASSVSALPWLRVHESRRLKPEHIVSRHGLPVTNPARSAIDRVAWQPFPRLAYALAAAVVQQRLTFPRYLRRELARAGGVRHVAHLRSAIADISGGAETIGEIDLASFCLHYGFMRPSRQRPREDRQGRRRYLDPEWDLVNGSRVVLEVDGSHHMAVEHWTADMKRERQVVIGARRSLVLRCSTVELRFDDEQLARDLAEAGVPRLVTAARGRGTGRR